MALTTGKSADATVIRPFAIEVPEPEIEVADAIVEVGGAR
jgi:hypothetical protein